MSKGLLELLDYLYVSGEPIDAPKLIDVEPAEILVFGVVDGARGDLAGETLHR